MFKKVSCVCLWVCAAQLTAEAEESGVVDRINQEIRQSWTDYGLKPSSPATDGEWVRRVFLDVLGRIPTTGELRAWESVAAKNRGEVARQLLRDDRYAAEFAQNWATIWTNVLVGRNGGNERNSLTSRAGLQKYLRDAFAENRPYNQIVQELLTAEGNNTPGLDEFNGAVNFLSMKLAERATQATADTSRIFLGKQVQCTQCHNHPFNDWKQNQFWELNSFFRQTVALRRFQPGERMVSHVYLTDQDFGGEGATPEEAEVYYELRDATLQAAYPVFIDGEEIANRSGFVEDVHRRAELAKFVTSSPEMPRAIVNRMWAHFLNYGFTTPVDDMGPHNPPTHPGLLDYLANQLVVNSFDLRLLMEWIVSSEAYSLSSRVTRHNQEDDPSKGERPQFSHYYMRQMRAEELYDSLLVATQADRTSSSSKADDTREEWLKQFVVAFGNDEGTERSTFNGTISQALVLFNGKVTKQALADEPTSLLSRLATSSAPLDKKVDHLFLAAVARKASKSERQAARQLISLRGGDQVQGLQDLWWAVLNSNEFILNH